MTKPFLKKQYFALTLDPIHVGTGGYRLGHVDNTILRENGTNLPIIPGSSLNGVLRAYTAMAIQSEVEGDLVEKKDGFWVVDCKKYFKMKYLRPYYALMPDESFNPLISKYAKVVTTNGDEPLIMIDKEKKTHIYHSCAGKGANGGEGHCGQHNCIVCVAFGFSRGNNGSFQGLVQLYDMRVIFFPIYTTIGTVWITSTSILKEAGIADIESDIPTDRFITTITDKIDSLYLGGFEMRKYEDENAQNISQVESIPKQICNKIVTLSNSCFSRMVNDNLEVRTSVSIDPKTGAAETGALFTFEAIPRFTVMYFDLIYNKPEFFRIGGKKIPFNETDLITEVEKGMTVMESLGIGGMNTRGMGRVEVLNLNRSVEEE